MILLAESGLQKQVTPLGGGAGVIGVKEWILGNKKKDFIHLSLFFSTTTFQNIVKFEKKDDSVAGPHARLFVCLYAVHGHQRHFLGRHAVVCQEFHGCIRFDGLLLHVVGCVVKHKAWCMVTRWVYPIWLGHGTLP